MMMPPTSQIAVFSTGGGSTEGQKITIKFLNANKTSFVPISILADSVSGETMLYWKEGENLKYGSMEDLFLSYSSSVEKDLFKVLSVRRNPKTAKARAGFPIPVICADNAEIYFQHIQDVTYHGIKPVWKVTLRNGKSIEVTKDHSIYYAKAYRTKMVPKSFLELDEKDAVISIDDYGFDMSPDSRYTNEMLIFMGLFLADGSYYGGFRKEKTKRSLLGISIATDNGRESLVWLKEFAEKIPTQKPYLTCKNKLESIFPDCKNLPFGYSSDGQVSIHRMTLAQTIFSEFGEVDSYTKRVPKFLFTASNEQICSFLKGYFTGDGSIHMHTPKPDSFNHKYGSYCRIDCSSVNRAMLEDISVLLDRLGIKHNISTPYKPSKTGYSSKQVFYKLIVDAEPSVKKFMNKIGFIKKHMYRQRETYQRDKKLRPISLRQIRNVEYIGEKPVYDIVGVKDTERFIANGICISNTGSDITLLSREDGERLGFSPQNAVSKFGVGGVGEGAVAFSKFTTQIQVGDLAPITVNLGVADRYGALRDNLLGRENVLSHFDITYSEDKVQFVPRGQKAMACGLFTDGRGF